MSQVRPSILTRPLHQFSRSHIETADEQYAKEQRRLDAKRQKFSAIEDMLKASRSPHPPPEQCASLQQAQDALLNSKAEREKREHELALQIARVQQQLQASEEMDEERRKTERFMMNRRAMEVNKALIAAKEARLQAEREAERKLENQNLALLLNARPNWR